MGLRKECKWLSSSLGIEQTIRQSDGQSDDEAMGQMGTGGDDALDRCIIGWRWAAQSTAFGAAVMVVAPLATDGLLLTAGEVVREGEMLWLYCYWRCTRRRSEVRSQIHYGVKPNDK